MHLVATLRFCASTSLNMDILAMLCCPWRIRGDVSDRSCGETWVLYGTVRICVPLTGCVFRGRYGKRWPA